jgi:hypothetical protein
MVYLFHFDNKYIGEIKQYIKRPIYNEKGKLEKLELNIQDNLIVNVINYKNNFTFIINECKNIFNIIETNYNIVSINDKPYLIYKNYNDIPLKNITITDFSNLYRLQKVFVFNWLMCINCNFENKIRVLPDFHNYEVCDIRNSTNLFFKTVGEKSFKKDNYEDILPRHIIKKYFNDSVENFYEIVKIMLKDIDVDSLKNKLIKLCKENGEDYIYWVNTVYKHLLNLKNL